MELRSRGGAKRGKPRFWRLGEEIRRARLLKQMDSAQLAKLVEISPGHWWRIEAGHTMPKPENLAKIGEKLDIPLESLVMWAEGGSEQPEQEVPDDAQAMLRFYLDQPAETKRLIRSACFLIGTLDKEQQKMAVTRLAMEVGGVSPEDLR